MSYYFVKKSTICAKTIFWIFFYFVKKRVLYVLKTLFSEKKIVLQNNAIICD